MLDAGCWVEYFNGFTGRSKSGADALCMVVCKVTKSREAEPNFEAGVWKSFFAGWCIRTSPGRQAQGRPLATPFAHAHAHAARGILTCSVPSTRAQADRCWVVCRFFQRRMRSQRAFDSRSG